MAKWNQFSETNKWINRSILSLQSFLHTERLIHYMLISKAHFNVWNISFILQVFELLFDIIRFTMPLSITERPKQWVNPFFLPSIISCSHDRVINFYFCSWLWCWCFFCFCLCVSLVVGVDTILFLWTKFITSVHAYNSSNDAGCSNTNESWTNNEPKEHRHELTTLELIAIVITSNLSKISPLLAI